MPGKEPTVWGIHAGKTGDAETLFAKRKVVALGWPETGDLTALKTRDEFKARVAETYPDMKPGAVPVNAGQLFRFIHEAAVGDIVAHLSKRDRQIHLGRITGPYRYDAAAGEMYPHQRSVEWVRSVPRSSFSQGALYEIGSAMSFFRIRSFATEFLAAIEGKATTTPVVEDETGPDADAIEEYTKDYVLKQLAQELKGHPLADLVAHLLETMGYRTRVSPPGPDRGVDIVAHRDELGFEPPIIKVQVKSKDGTVGDPEVSALYGKVSGSEFGLLVTLGSYSNQARSFAEGKSNLRLIDGSDLVDLLLLHYEQLDSRYKGLLPLRRVYVPERIEETEG